MYSPVYPAGIYPPTTTMYLPMQSVAGAIAGCVGPPSPAVSSPLLSYFAPYPIAPLSDTASPTIFNDLGVETLDNLPLLMVENTPLQLRKLFVGGLPHEVDNSELLAYFAQFGVIMDAVVIRDGETKISRGFGFVTFASIESADFVMANRPHTIRGKMVDTKRAIAKDQMSMLQNGISPPTFLIVEPAAGCRLAIFSEMFTAEQGPVVVDELRIYFEQFGPLEQVEIVGPQLVGQGFIVYERREDADRCLKHGDNHQIHGYTVQVRNYSDLYGYNIHYPGGVLQYYRPGGGHASIGVSYENGGYGSPSPAALGYQKNQNNQQQQHRNFQSYNHHHNASTNSSPGGSSSSDGGGRNGGSPNTQREFSGKNVAVNNNNGYSCVPSLNSEDFPELRRPDSTSPSLHQQLKAAKKNASDKRGNSELAPTVAAVVAASTEANSLKKSESGSELPSGSLGSEPTMTTNCLCDVVKNTAGSGAEASSRNGLESASTSTVRVAAVSNNKFNNNNNNSKNNTTTKKRNKKTRM